MPDEQSIPDPAPYRETTLSRVTRKLSDLQVSVELAYEYRHDSIKLHYHVKQSETLIGEITRLLNEK